MDNETSYFEDEVFEVKDTRRTIKRFLKSMGRQKLRLAVVFLSIGIYTFFTIIAPLYSANVVDLIWNRIKEPAAGGESCKAVFFFGE